MLRHWEAVRDAIRVAMDDDLMTAGARPEEKDALAAKFANEAIAAYTHSIFKDLKPLPRSGHEPIFTGSYDRK